MGKRVEMREASVVEKDMKPGLKESTENKWRSSGQRRKRLKCSVGLEECERMESRWNK